MILGKLLNLSPLHLGFLSVRSDGFNPSIRIKRESPHKMIMSVAGLGRLTWDSSSPSFLWFQLPVVSSLPEAGHSAHVIRLHPIT